MDVFLSIFLYIVLVTADVVVVFLHKHNNFFLTFGYNTSYIYLLYIILSGDVETNPGHWQCRMLYSNIRGPHVNLPDLLGASEQHDILFCSETLVSGLRHLLELLLPGF